MNPRKTITPLLWRVIVFLCLAAGIASAAGPRIISGGILFRDGFALYGGIGKALIFGVIAFVLLVRHRKSAILLRPWRPALLGWIGVSGVAFALAWMSIGNLLAGQRNPGSLIAAHAGLILSLAFAAAGCIGLKNIRTLWQTYRRETLNSLGIAGLFYVFLLAVYALWRPLASVVLFSVRGLLGLNGLQATVIPPNILVLSKFGITVAQYCSGIESIALFTGLYVIVGLLDWERLNKTRYFIVFPFALLLLFGLNIVRVYGLILAGYYINPKNAFSLFHTYAGMVFFILYSAAFWLVAYKYLLEENDAPSHGRTA
jgi:exosortase/archaeosortase family protein